MLHDGRSPRHRVGRRPAPQPGDCRRWDLWVRHGLAQAINAGDLMLMLPYSVLDHLFVDDGVKWRLTRILARNAENIVRGQASELDLLIHERLDWKAYASATEGKTAAAEIAVPVRSDLLYRVTDDERRLIGWMNRVVLSNERTGMVLLDGTTLHRAPEPDSPAVALMEDGLVGKVDRCQDGWCEMRFAEISGWLPQSKLYGVGRDEVFR